MTQEDFTIMEIGRRLHASNKRIAEILRDAGIEKRRRRVWLRGASIHIPNDVCKIGYMAGIIDGEGCLYLKKGEKESYSVQVANTSKDLMCWIQKEFGGFTTRYEPPRPNHKVLYTWRIGNILGVRDILCAVIPYLVIKKKKAIAFLEYCEAKISSFKGYKIL